MSTPTEDKASSELSGLDLLRCPNKKQKNVQPSTHVYEEIKKRKGWISGWPNERSAAIEGVWAT